MSKGSAFGIVLVALALAAALWATSIFNVPALITLLLLTPIVTAALLLSARRNRP